MDLRQDRLDEGPGAKNEDQVWNQAVYKYLSRMEQDPDALGDELTEKIRQIKITTIFMANTDFPPPSAGNPKTGAKRQQEAVYILIYDDQGEICPDAARPKKQNWISMKLLQKGPPLFIPGFITDVTKLADEFTGASRPLGDNPFVTSKRLRELGVRRRFF